MDIPPRHTPEDKMTEYMKARRQVEKLAKDPKFLNAVGARYETVVDFLKEYNLNAKDIDVFLNMNLSDFIPKAPPQKRKKH